MQLYSLKRGRSHSGLWLSILMFVAVVSVVLLLISGMEQRVDLEQTRRLEDTVRRAAITCYAVEGRYPPTLAYMTEHYGVMVDEDRYIVRYDVFAENLMPVISVIWLEGVVG